jgi:hypothetical protein
MLRTRLRSKCEKHLCKISTQTDTFWPQLYILPTIYLISVNTVISNGAVGNIIVCDFRLQSGSICGLLGYCAGSVGNSYRRFGTTYRSHLQGVNCPKISVRSYHYSLRSSPEQCSSQIYTRYTYMYIKVGTLKNIRRSQIHTAVHWLSLR